jgi:hypothetical protein
MSIAVVKVLLGLLFLGFSCLAFFSMLHLLGAPHTPYEKLLRITHRAAGAAAVVLFVLVSVMCLGSVIKEPRELPAGVVLHLTIAALFIPFILIKIVIVEKYPELRNRLFANGTVLFATAFLIVATSPFVYLARGGEAGSPEMSGRVAVDMAQAKDLFVVKCSKCHRLDRPLGVRKTPQEWRQTVNDMRQKDPTWISQADGERITEFLISIGGQTGDD